MTIGSVKYDNIIPETMNATSMTQSYLYDLAGTFSERPIIAVAIGFPNQAVSLSAISTMWNADYKLINEVGALVQGEAQSCDGCVI